MLLPVYFTEIQQVCITRILVCIYKCKLFFKRHNVQSARTKSTEVKEKLIPKGKDKETDSEDDTETSEVEEEAKKELLDEKTQERCLLLLSSLPSLPQHFQNFNQTLPIPKVLMSGLTY